MGTGKYATSKISIEHVSQNKLFTVAPYFAMSEHSIPRSSRFLWAAFTVGDVVSNWNKKNTHVLSEQSSHFDS